ncbi:uroporphyrinogen-III C-methyltransferase [Thalassotalea sp. G2M2-11]|uniref:uroporphyrinogen-III C-methyltransferase n=1 Tax=Thalassotalea sp. G2M2-11 TaxID=2787627 RepID=UPI0019CF9C71|nr:uroporphyrinogen-III C-methyltransferase [Thalassotalea sp. G2M2-11]
MTDKNSQSPQIAPSENNKEGSAKQTADSKEKASSSTTGEHSHTSQTTKAVSSTAPNKSRSVNKTTTPTKAKVPPANSLSKTAVLALIIALISAGGIGGVHYLHTQQNAQQVNQLQKQIAQNNQQSAQKVQQLLAQQQAQISQQVATAVDDIQQSSEVRISQLEQQIARLAQREPSDWLLHEAEYLTRIAARTLWLERDTAAAINLLSDADSRIKELNNPVYLPIRQLIHQDIEALKLMPALETEEVTLQLLALSKQIPQLNFAMAKIPDSQTQQEDLQLSDSPSDWRSNLAKTWQRFLADFITVRRRVGQVEPLMSPQHQQNLKENLALKVQQIQWAASKENKQLYQASIDEVQQWLTEYFDLGHLATAQFYQEIQLLKEKIVSLEQNIDLRSHQALRQRIKQEKQLTPLEKKPAQSENAPEPQSPVEQKVDDQASTTSNEVI